MFQTMINRLISFFFGRVIEEAVRKAIAVTSLFPIASITDCGGQAFARMKLRFEVLLRDAAVTTIIIACDVEGGGNLIDALDAMHALDATRSVECAVTCNYAPRQKARHINGDRIAFGKIGRAWVVTTIRILALTKKVIPDLQLRILDTDKFVATWLSWMKRVRFNFRGLEVIPEVLRALRDGVDLDDISEPLYDFGQFDPSIWLVDEIERRRCNLKLTYLRSDLPDFRPGRIARVTIHGHTLELICRDKITDGSGNKPFLYEGSSGIGQERFLEIAVFGGSAADYFSELIGQPIEAGEPIEIVDIFDRPEETSLISGPISASA